MDSNMVHLVKITVANLPCGCINPTEEQIISAMNKAVEKEQNMGIQLIKRDDIMGSFKSLIAQLFWEKTNAKG